MGKIDEIIIIRNQLDSLYKDFFIVHKCTLLLCTRLCIVDTILLLLLLNHQSMPFSIDTIHIYIYIVYFNIFFFYTRVSSCRAIEFDAPVNKLLFRDTLYLPPPPARRRTQRLFSFKKKREIENVHNNKLMYRRRN